jgi:hypothetical protein
MAKIKSKANEGSTLYKPVFGRARHDQIVRAAWAAESHNPQPGTARQKIAKRKPGRYGGR